MNSGLPSALDNLSRGGIINFDADAYLHGRSSSYVAPAQNYLPFEQPLNVYHGGQIPQCQNYSQNYSQHSCQLPGQPSYDAFVNKEQQLDKPADWKKSATAVLLAGLLVIGGFKYKDKIASLFSKKAAPAPTPVAPPVTPVTPPVTPAAPAVAKKSIFKTIGAKLKAMPKWAKVTGGVVAGLVVLYQTAKAVLIHKLMKAQAQEQALQTQEQALQVQAAQAGQESTQATPQAATPITEPQQSVGPIAQAPVEQVPLEQAPQPH